VYAVEQFVGIVVVAIRRAAVKVIVGHAQALGGLRGPSLKT